MAYITLSSGEQVLVDDCDLDRLSDISWCLKGRGPWDRYAAGKLGGKRIYMHRFILQAPAGSIVDHANGDTFDNRRANLRFATPSQSSANTKRTRDAKDSRYRGVRPSHSKWKARIKLNGKYKHLGMHATEEEAALAYNAAAIRIHGEFARLNVIEGIAS